MDSSISHSKWPVPRLALAIFVAALMSWGAGAAYTLLWNPEVAFFKRVSRTRTSWAERLGRAHGYKIVFFGGSSCMFSVDGERMLEKHGLPVVNKGCAAGMNAKMLTEYGIDAVGPGDTLVVALEPGLLINEIEPTALAYQFSYAMGAPHWIGGRLLPKWPTGPGSWLHLRPGAYHAFTLIGKLASGKPSYRYTSALVHPSGFVETSVRPPLLSPIPPASEIVPDARTLLRSLSEWALTNHVQVYYSLPWAHVAPERLRDFRQKNAAFLLNMSEFLPVLKDASLGGRAERAVFSDTEWHLSPEGSAQKTDDISTALLTKQFWTRDELRILARSTP